MSLLPVPFFFLLGTIFGSFFNVVGLRLPNNKQFTHGRSYCPSCKHPLSWFELIPVLSFCMQAGKCRHCKSPISKIYPLIETFTGFLFLFSYLYIGMQMELVTALLFVSMLLIIFISDFTYMIIPNKILLFFFPLFIIMRMIQPIDPWWSTVLGAFVAFLLILIIIVISRGGIGAGDMKLFGVIGIVLGLEKVLLAFFLSCVLGSVLGLILLVFKRISRKQAIPFGPYIVVAAILSFFYGENMITWYFNLF